MIRSSLHFIHRRLHSDCKTIFVSRSDSKILNVTWELYVYIYQHTCFIFFSVCFLFLFLFVITEEKCKTKQEAEFVGTIFILGTVHYYIYVMCVYM